MWRGGEGKEEAEVDGQCECGLESDEDGCNHVEGRRKGRLKRRWMDSVNVDLRVMRMDVEGRRRKGRSGGGWTV